MKDKPSVNAFVNGILKALPVIQCENWFSLVTLKFNFERTLLVRFTVKDQSIKNINFKKHREIEVLKLSTCDIP